MQTPPLRTAADFPPEVLRLFDQYVHNVIDRRGFLEGAARYAASGLTAAALLEALSPRFAEAQQVAPTDRRLHAERVSYPSPHGNAKTSGYLVRPAEKGPSAKHAAVLVIHENRGLNPHIEDVARRLALEGFVTFAPDALAPLGGYPGDEDKARELFTKLDQAKTREDFVAAAANDERINASWPAYEQALKGAHVRYEAHVYPGTQHGFNNDTTPRYDAAAAKLAWQRTVAFLDRELRK